MKSENYKKLQDIEKFYYKKKKAEYDKLMKKRRRRTYLVVTLIVLSIVSVASYEFLFRKEYSTYLKAYGSDEKVSNTKLNEELKNFKNKIVIKNVNYDFSPELEGLESPETLVIHHSVSKGASPEEINKWHKEKGYGGIGYHYYIKKDGTIFKGRPDEKMGAHAYNNNRKSIAICLDGNFEEDKLTDSQNKSLIDLATSLIVTYNLKDIVGHRNLNETACPGKNIDIESIKKDVLKNIENNREKI
ncbi:MAG: peptidoglycan recognition protein family protein [Clostridium chrysemydis]|uniref:peptidoglycan recognition protein family protein n=1 Tax=Clostridium chrysemydis TaxID=2665504 RepID=UPI003F2DB506